MATKDALYYSCRAGRPDTVKSHRTRSAAINAAGEFGQIYDSGKGRQRQVHRAVTGDWITVEPDKHLAVDLASALHEYGLLSDNQRLGDSPNRTNTFSTEGGANDE